MFCSEVLRQERDDQTESDYSHIYPIADASLWFDGQHGPICESVLKLLKDIQIDGDEATESRTFDLVRALCRKFEQLQVTEIERSFDLDAEQTILTAITETKAFPLASLTSSDHANSVDELADQLFRIANLLIPDFEASRLSCQTPSVVLGVDTTSPKSTGLQAMEGEAFLRTPQDLR